MVLGALILIYATLAVIRDRDEALIGLLIGFVALPALLVSLLGYFMRQGKAWATWSIRVVLIAIVTGGILLDLVMGLDVFHKPLIAIPLIAGSFLWLLLSFR